MLLTEFYCPADSLTRSPPANLALGDERLFASESTRALATVRPFQVKHVRIHADGACFRQVGLLNVPTLVFPQYTWSRQHVLKAGLILTRAASRATRGLVRREFDRGLLLTDLYFGGFFHWFGDVLPKVAALADAGIDLRDEQLLLPACRDAAYVGDTLAPYGLRAKVIQPHEYAAVAQLTFVPRLSPSGNFRPTVMRSLAETMRTHCGASLGSNRIYVTRARAAKRRLLNEAEIVPILVHHGFQVVCMEELSFPEQVRLAASSEAIAGLHGAGLTHALWMPPGGRVLEIRAAGDRFNNCYYALASDLGHTYYYALANKQPVVATMQSADFTVDVGHFKQAIDSIR